MPINNQKGLEALRALSQGGTPALDAYNKAQGVETASRTSALDKALGGQDLGAAVAKAQAQYAPKVPTAGLNVADLNPAAENYLSRASDKLATQQYSDQQNLAYQAEALRRKENELTAEERQAQLLGAAELMGQHQQDVLTGNAVTDLANRRNDIANKLAEYDRLTAQGVAPGVAAAAAEAGAQGATPGAVAGAAQGLFPPAGPGAAAGLASQGFTAPGAAAGAASSGLVPPTGSAGAVAGQGVLGPEGGALQNAADAQRAEILSLNRDDLVAQKAALEEEYRKAAGEYTGLLGRDTKGLEEALATGDTRAVAGLMDFLSGEASKKAMEVPYSTQERLRQLAPAFGIDPLTAEGRFREGEGDDLSRQAKIAQEKARAGGKLTAGEQKAVDQEQAANLGFASGSQYAAARNQSKMTDDEINELMQSEDWLEIDSLATGFAVGDTSITGKDASGLKGFQEALQKKLDEQGWDDESTKAVSALATSYYNSRVGKQAGSGERAN